MKTPSSPAPGMATLPPEGEGSEEYLKAQGKILVAANLVAMLPLEAFARQMGGVNEFRLLLARAAGRQAARREADDRRRLRKLVEALLEVKRVVQEIQQAGKAAS